MNWETPLQEFVAISKYSRWDWNLGRRQTWEEGVARYFEFMLPRVPSDLRLVFEKCRQDVLNLRVMPSMRALWTAGKALELHNAAAYNCAYLTLDCVDSFAEMLYLLACGCGVGYSVESKYISQFPVVPKELKECDSILVVEDSKEGWAESFRDLLNLLFQGKIPGMDFSGLRKEGAILKTFGGRASGPAPLKRLFDFTVSIFKKAAGRQLTDEEIYDIGGYIAQAIISGGVRRSATISLSDLQSKAMRDAKTGEFWSKNPQRSYSNNSVAYDSKPDMETFIQEWISLAKSGSGERGIFSRPAADKVVQKTGRRLAGFAWGCNPCSEILLRPLQFCNLTEVVIRPSDTLTDLCDKIKTAVALGCLQSTLTDFKFLRSQWKANCEEERLLGVSLTGMRDHEILGGFGGRQRLRDWLKTMKDTAIRTAKKWSKELGINMPAAITCVKPSGTVSKLVNTAPGLHDRWAPFQIQRVRGGKTDPISRMLIDQGVPYQQAPESDSLLAFDFPREAPEGSKSIRDSRSALKQLEYWKDIQLAWCEHKPSCTIYVKEDEWLEVGAWVFKNFDLVSGISFQPHNGTIHPVAPNQEITEAEYREMVSKFPVVNFSKLPDYEAEDYTTGAQELACMSGSCEFI